MKYDRASLSTLQRIPPTLSRDQAEVRFKLGGHDVSRLHYRVGPRRSRLHDCLRSRGSDEKSRVDLHRRSEDGISAVHTAHMCISIPFHDSQNQRGKSRLLLCYLSDTVSVPLFFVSLKLYLLILSVFDRNAVRAREV